jgi:hypothetical protein
MKQIKTVISILLFLLFPNLTWSQNEHSDLSEILQTYYKSKDGQLVIKTINFANSDEANFEELQPIFTGFFGALFYSDADIKNQFKDKLQSFTNENFKQLFGSLIYRNGSSLFDRSLTLPSQNDMFWSAYFATGDSQYLDKIIANAALAEDRADINLFLTGASASWSLCSNAKQNDDVRNYLVSKKDSTPLIKEILEAEPSEFKAKIVKIIKEQREKGVWK